MWWILVGAAFADEPQVTVRADGTVVAQAKVQASAQKIKSVLANPTLLAQIDGSTSVQVQQSGTCMILDYDIPHPIAQVKYRARACPTADGWQYTLMSSEELKSYEAVWRVTPMSDEQCELSYEFRITPDMPIPQWMVSRQSSRAVDGFMRRLISHLENK